MAKLPFKKVIVKHLERSLLKAVRENRPEDEAIAVAAHSAAVFLDNHVLRFKQSTPHGIALEAGSDWLIYEILEPAIVKLARDIVDELVKGEEGKVWAVARDLKVKAKARKAARKAKKEE